MNIFSFALCPSSASFLSALAAFSILFTPMPARSQRETPPAPSPPRPARFPSPVERTLSNGLRVVVIEKRGAPLAVAQLLIKNGGEVDPPALAGVAQMTASLVTQGTATRTAPQIAEAVEALGGELESGASWDASIVNVDVEASKLNQAMAILADVARRPAFKEEEVARLRQQTLDGLSVALQQPGQLARLVAARVVFGDSPYGHALSGTPQSIARIKRDDIVAMHNKFYRPDNAVLVVGGGVNAEDVFKLAQNLFGDWKNPDGTLTAVPAAKVNNGNNSTANQTTRVVVVDKPDAGQAAVIVARAGINRKDADFFRALVANSVLGLGYSARLNQEIRIKRGLSYGAFSSLDARRDTGPFIATTQTKNESGAEVAAILVGELERLATAPLAETELAPRKSTLTGNFGRSLETTEGLVNFVARLALQGLGFDEINRYVSNVQAVTGDDVRKFAGARLDVKRANVVIVGKASAFIDDLRKRFPNVEVIAASELDLNSANLRSAVTNPAGN